MVGAALCSLGGDLVLQLVALRILGGICSYKLRLPFGPLALELVITAGIKRGLAVIEVKDVIDDIVQQVALMAHHHNRRPIGAEEGFQQQRRLQAELVGRLVQQQQVWIGKQHPSQRSAPPPSAGKARYRVVWGKGGS